MSYTHLTRDDRIKLAAWIAAGKSPTWCAQRIGVDKSTISRELARNPGNDGIYRYGSAQRKTKERRCAANQQHCRIRYDDELQRIIERLLTCKHHYAPEQIAGRLKRIYGYPIVSHETIYQFIYHERTDLKVFLRCKKRKYRRKRGTTIREKQRKEAEIQRIDTRPEIVEERGRIGDWEGDVMKGGERTTGILVHVERKSGYTLGTKLDRITAKNVEQGTKQSFQRIPKKKRHTATYDNGSEFAHQDMLERASGCDTYAAHPYHSWERGTNENTIGLLREYFPKKTPLANVDQQEVDEAVDALNHRPRKRLGYLTPHEVFWGTEPVAL